jgi:hypothetical protein
VEHLTKPAEDYKTDIHAAKGFGCAACHGGDGTIMGLEGMDPKKGYIGKPKPAQVVELCGKCHSDAALCGSTIRTCASIKWRILHVGAWQALA